MVVNAALMMLKVEVMIVLGIVVPTFDLWGCWLLPSFCKRVLLTCVLLAFTAVKLKI